MAHHSTYGQALGIVMQPDTLLRLPGDVGNATTFPFPVRYEIVPDVDPGDLKRPERARSLAPRFAEAARTLERGGVRLIGTGCGYLGLMQRELQAAVGVPVLSSSLIQVPWVARTLAPGRRVGIITADRRALGDAYFEPLGWTTRAVPVAIRGIEDEERFLTLPPPQRPRRCGDRRDARGDGARGRRVRGRPPRPRRAGPRVHQPTAVRRDDAAGMWPAGLRRRHVADVGACGRRAAAVRRVPVGPVQRYVLLRLASVLPTLLGVAIVVFILIRMIPGDPAEVLLGGFATPARTASLRYAMGLDRPLPVQFGLWIDGIVRGDLGRSIMSQRPVTQELWSRFPATLELTVTAQIIAVTAGVTLGVVSATAHNTGLDLWATLVSVVGMSMPIFWLGLMLLYVFGIWLNLLPISGRLGLDVSLTHITALDVLDSVLAGNWPALVDALKHLVLPALSLAVIPLASSRGSHGRACWKCYGRTTSRLRTRRG